MQSRRNFIKTTSGAIALAGLSFPKFSNAFTAAANIPAPGVQLFTYFNFIDNDVADTMQKIAASGVKNIESAFSRKGDYYGMPAKEFAALLQGLGMKWRSHHVFGAPVKMQPGNTLVFKNLVENMQQIIDDAAAGGVEYLVAAHIPIGTGKEISTALDILNKSAEATKKAGIQLIYHNEPADFANVEGKVPYEVFLTETDTDALKFELDVAWAVKAGADPGKLIERYPGRFPLWHLKDFQQDQKTVVPIGQGVLDNKKYLAYAKKAGLKYYFIEHEAAADPFSSVTASIAEIKKITG